MPVPFSFSAATTAIPLSQLDSNFDTPITLGNTAIQLGNTVTTLNNMTLANVTISSGNVTITNVTVTTANATTVNTTTLIATTANVTTGNVTNLISGNVSLTGGNITSTAISGSTGSFTTLTTSNTVTINGGTANGVAYLDGSKVLTTGSALTFDGTKFGIGGTAIQKLSVFGTNSNFHLNPDSSGNVYGYAYNDAGAAYTALRWDAVYHAFLASGNEQMRLTSTGLGIGTSSPWARLSLAMSNGQMGLANGNTSGGVKIQAWNAAGNDDGYLAIEGYTKEYARFDSSGNLGLGVTPSAWASNWKAFQIGSRSLAQTGSGAGDWTMAFNAVFDSTDSRWEYQYTGDSAVRYSQTGAGIHAWYTAPSGTAGNAITFTQAMTLDASGNLGVGETSPALTLHVKSAAAAIGYFETSNTGTGPYVIWRNGTTSIGDVGSAKGISGSGNATDFMIASRSTYPLLLGTGSTERARIDSGGNLGVGRGAGGDTTVGATLYANGTVTCARSSSSNGDLNLYVYSTGAAAARFYVGMAGTVYATSTTITAISDQRLKENIQDIDVGLDAIMALKPRKFDWKTGKGKDKKGDRGWIAQEFEQVFPDMVDTWADPAPEGEEPYKAVNADLIPVLVKAIQELKAEFDAYKATHP